MGKIIKLECPACHHYEEIIFNNDNSDKELGQIISRLSDYEFDIAQQWLKENEIKSYKSVSVLTFCPICKKLETSNILEITSFSGNRKSFGLRCYTCHTEKDIIDIDNYIPCPECENKMKIVEMGY